MDNPENIAPEMAAEAAKAFEAPMKDMRETMRAMVEKGVVEQRARYAEMKSAASEATAALETSFNTAQSGVVAFNVKAIEALKAGAEAQFDFFKSLASAKSMSELVTLNTEFARKRFEDASAQSKELAELARKVATEAAAPLQAQVAKGMEVAKSMDVAKGMQLAKAFQPAV